MLEAGERRRLEALDRRLVEIAAWVNTSSLLNPTLPSRQRALAELRQGVRTGRYTDPWLEYLPLPMDLLHRSEAALDALDFGDSPVDQLLAQQRDALLIQLELLVKRGTPEFGALAAEIYGLPDDALVAEARSTVEAEARQPSPPPVLTGLLLSAAELQQVMEEELERMGIADWTVLRVDEMSARMSVSARHREVRIKSDADFSEEDRDRLIVHELHTHVVRAHNGFQTGLLNLGLGLDGYLATEEGLASYMEARSGLLRPHHLYIYALRALGAHLGHHLGFAAMMRELVELGTPPGVAWDVAIRVKRGLVETGAPGCFPKDYVYLQGRALVSDHLEAGGTLEELFIGKVAVGQLAQVRELLAIWGGGPAHD